ncbi:class II fumarate hydratase [Candidatus Sumerlaeota bacterium]|nr:class II fumarate hydratase [Candidatus Sumerlaeota bacterium]
MGEFRIEKDSLGEIRVPAEALYSAQTQRAVDNFPISGIRFPRPFIRALGLIKAAAAQANLELALLDAELGKAIMEAADEVAGGKWDEHFPIDIYQTGSGTSTNMNANEVIATRASQILGKPHSVHPNDHVNMGQSSNDVIPTAIHVAACIEVQETLLPGMNVLRESLLKRAEALKHVVKTGRTHLMDAMPLTLGQELGGWAFQVQQCIERTQDTMRRMRYLPQGGTAVGTGINAHPSLGRVIAAALAEKTGIPFEETPNHFAAQSAMDAPAELSGQLKTSASALMKIANDLRWMNSGPIAGLNEITLPGLQPGSSIMPGKINPVICEAMMMVCGQVIANDTAVAIGNARGNFQLNVMLPLIAHNLLNSITILGNACRVMAEKAVDGFKVHTDRIGGLVAKNPILVTALNAIIGYDKAAMIAKRAYAEGRTLKEVALEETKLSAADLDRILDPIQLAEGGIKQ